MRAMAGGLKRLSFATAKGARRFNSSFFNRVNEMRQLQAVTRRGKLLLVTGPDDSGKSALLTEFIRLQRNHEIPGYPILIDMRGGAFHNSAAFCNALKRDSTVMTSLMGKALEGLDSKVLGEDKAMAVQLLKASFAKLPQSNDLNTLLDALYSLLSSYKQRVKTYLRGHAAGFPSLIIDEANCLHDWAADPVEANDLKALHRFFIKVTKQDHVANVIMATSEDFFSFYLDYNMGASRYSTGVVGDLLKEEAFQFFRKVLKQEEGVDIDIPSSVWDDIFDVLGGRMLLLQELAEKSASFNDPVINHWPLLKEEFVFSARLEAERGFHPSSFRPKWAPHFPLPSSPCDVHVDLLKDSRPVWTEKEWKVVLEATSKAPLGVVAVASLVSAGVPHKAVLSMVQHNLLHYRRQPCPLWARDLAEYKGSYPIVMPKSRPHYKVFCQLAAGA